MPQLIMYWKNDGKPSEMPTPPAGCTFVQYPDLPGAMDAWLDIVQYGLSNGRMDEDFYNRVMRDRPNYRASDCWFVVSDGVPAATVTVICDDSTKKGYVHMVACKPEFRGRGYGTLMNALTCAQLKARGMETAHLTTDDFRIPAIRSYLRAGFVPDETTDDFRARWKAIREVIGK